MVTSLEKRMVSSVFFFPSLESGRAECAYVLILGLVLCFWMVLGISWMLALG